MVVNNDLVYSVSRGRKDPTAHLNVPVKGWEQYDCVKKYLQPSQRSTPERPRDVNPVLDAIKKMFSD
jgi:hypothetical protein